MPLSRRSFVQVTSATAVGSLLAPVLSGRGLEAATAAARALRQDATPPLDVGASSFSPGAVIRLDSSPDRGDASCGVVDIKRDDVA